MFKQANIAVYLILGIIFIAALFLRLYRLSEFPVGFHIDEASLGYNGYSLLLTGKDENNNRFPLYIDMFGDNRPSGYHYLTVLPIKIFGLTEFSTRLPGALFGSITVFAIFFFTLSIFQNKKLGLLAALFLAISPWHIILSRASAEAVVALFFILLGFSLVILSLRKEKIEYMIAGTATLSLSFFFYHTPRVFVPLLFIVFLALLFLLRKSYRTNLWKSLIGSAIFLVVTVALLVLFIPGGTGRFSQVNIFNSFETKFQLQKQIQEDTLAHDNFLLSRAFHNKVTNIGVIFIGNYLEYFSGEFLFAKGGLPIWYNVPRMGLLYLLELPFFLIGLVVLINSKYIFHKIPLVWLLVAPIIAAITYDDIPNINRAAVMFPMFHIIAAAGLLHVYKKVSEKRKILLSFCFFGLLSLNSIYFLHQYFVNAKTSKPWYRNNGFSKAMIIVNGNYSNYDVVVMSKFQGGIYPLVLFYSKYEPEAYQKEGSPKNKDYSGFGKFFFVPQDCPSVQPTEAFLKEQEIKKLKVLYIDKGDCLEDSLAQTRRREYIFREDGTKAFRIVYD